MASYYNDNDKHSAKWLRALIAAGLIPPGDVDERSIKEVMPDDLRGYRQCHFFAGIGGWAYALSLAGVDSDEPLWTGSCPCQPFSRAGDGAADSDPRNLWPDMFRLVRECRPVRVLGEQVPDAIGHGWYDGICGDLESAGYAVGACVLGAHTVQGPHVRQRLYWAATDPDRPRIQGLVEGADTRVPGPWGWRGEEDLQALAESPFVGNGRWPAPLLCPVVDGFPGRVGVLHGAGNAIVPQVAALFIRAFMVESL